MMPKVDYTRCNGTGWVSAASDAALVQFAKDAQQALTKTTSARLSWSDLFRARVAELQLTQKQTAASIANRTKRPCSVRAVQAWLADQRKPSARPCPEWALRALLPQDTTVPGCSEDRWMQATGHTMTPSEMEVIRDMVAAEQDRCCTIVFGQCASDNVAQRTVAAIRTTKDRV